MSLTQFHHLLKSHFNKSELRSLCFELQIDYESLSGTTLEDNSRELIIFAYRHGLTELLINRCVELRPFITWPNVQSILDSLNETKFNSYTVPANPPPKTKQTIYGKYNAISSSGGNSTINVNNYERPSPTPEEFLERGIRLLQAQSYRQAIDPLNSAIQANPTNPKHHFYLAIALLNGVRPKLVALSTVKKIEQHLQTATILEPQFGQAYILWAIVKYDHYVMNGMFDRKPTIHELLNRRWSIDKAQTNELLIYIQAPKNQVWEWLHSL